MAKNPNSRPRPAKREEPMNGAMKFFLAGCVAELYLLIIRRFYINGTGKQVVAWDSYLIGLAWAGVAVAAIGAVLSFLWRADQKKRKIGWVILGRRVPGCRKRCGADQSFCADAAVCSRSGGDAAGDPLVTL